MSVRPRRLVVVTGTGTEIGKTWVSAALARALRARGWVVSARKPAQSFDPFDPFDPAGAAMHDADVLAEATDENPADVCPPHRNYEVALAPPMAADALGRPGFTVAELAGEVAGSWPPHAVDVGIVELAGGFRSPQATSGAEGAGPAGDDCRAFADALAPDVLVVVADAGLGTINSVRSTLDAAGDAWRGATVVILNRFDESSDLHQRNLRWLSHVDGVDVVVSVGELTERVDASLERYCVACGRTTVECDGCLDAFEAPRRCPRCGRRLRVVVAPTSVTATCRLHGAIA